MSWWVWTLIGGAAVLLIVDWIIVMGVNPREWKGGMREYEHSEIRGQSGRKPKSRR